ncbi:hypothetical protein LQW54_012245 [Pestalotiopsis sp. IQ-011]
MALKRARMRHYTRIVWIDAVCINQDDIGERGHQVGLMPQIYSGAKTVLMYIGEISLYPPTVQRMAVQSVLDVELPIPPPCWTEMLSSRYFTRLWVLQEVALARKAILMCGEQSFPWNLVRENAKCAGSGYLPPVFHFDHNAYSNPNQVINLLGLAKSCHAADPRDKVFALLGLLPSRRIGNLAADYSLTVEEVYMRVALQLASHVGWLPILAQAGTEAQNKSDLYSLPSWVPDWTTPAVPCSAQVLNDGWANDTGDSNLLDVTYHESEKAIGLRLLHTPGLDTQWHDWNDDAAQMNAEYLCFQPGAQGPDETELYCIPITVAVQILTVTAIDPHLVAILGRIPNFVVPEHMKATDFAKLSGPRDIESLTKLINDQSSKMEPVDDELEQLWMRTFLKGELAKLSPLPLRSDESPPSTFVRDEQQSLLMSLNDAFWRLLVRCFSMQEKHIKIV